LEILPVGQKLHSVGLLHPELNALKADDTLYTVLALQPEGHICITEDEICHANRGKAQLQMQAFFQGIVGKEQQPDLVICPEYSVPWNVLLELLEEGVVPQAGKLWVLGCESLPLGRLDEYRARLGEGFVVIDDDESPVQKTTQKYRNPLVYLFKTYPEDGQSERIVLLVQYKTETSGDRGNTEARGMLPGRYVYLWGRGPGEVRLLTLICSDAFGFKEDIISEHYDGLLLLHIQLNNSPRHVLYKQYRQTLFGYGGRTELICLNWAENVVITDATGAIKEKWGNIGGSAWYLLPTTFDSSDNRVSENHIHGIYYTRYEPIKVHALQFNYHPQAFLLEATKVYHHGIQKPKSTLSGPRAITTFVWLDKENVWYEPAKPEEQPSDGFEALVNRVTNVTGNLDDLLAVYRTGPVLAERVLAISAGGLGPSTNWYEASRIDSMKLCQHEIVHRVTVAQDPEGAEFRSTRLACARAIADLRKNGYAWPAEVEFLHNGFRFRWSQMLPHRNVEAADGTLATVIYAGLLGDPEQLERLDQRVRQTLAGPPPEPDRELSKEEMREHRRNHFSRPLKLCVLYGTASGTENYRSSAHSSYTVPAGLSPVDIATPSPRRVAGELSGAQQ
jgi:hypothetical protein